MPDPAAPRPPTQAACSFAFAISVSIGGVIGTPLGGALSDWVLHRARGRGPPASAAHVAAREASLVAGVIFAMMLLGLLAMAGAEAGWEWRLPSVPATPRGLA